MNTGEIRTKTIEALAKRGYEVTDEPQDFLVINGTVEVRFSDFFIEFMTENYNYTPDDFAVNIIQQHDTVMAE